MAGAPPSSIDKSLYEHLDVTFALQAAGLGVWELDPLTNQVVWDDRCRQLFGLATDNKLPYQQAIQFIHAEDAERVNQAVQWAMNPQSDGHYDQIYRVTSPDDGRLRWVHFQGKAYFNASGQLTRFAGIAQEVTPQVEAQQKLLASEARFRALIEEAPVPTMLMVGPDHTVEVANQAMLAMLGKDASIVGRPATAAVPELAVQPYLQLLDQVLASGTTYEAKAMPGQLVNNGVTTLHYFDFTYKPLRSPAGQVYGILSMAHDTTHQIVAQQQLMDSEARFRNLVITTPAATAVFVGRDMRIDQVNAPMLAIWGKDESVLGQPLHQALPELEGQPFLAQLQHVFDTGEPFRHAEGVAHVLEHGHPKTVYFNHAYNPLYQPDGRIYGVINTATDVTQQVLSRQALEHARAQMQIQLECLVEQRTRELSLANQDLQRANDNLQQFAYIASHDLQEPLRKIQAFSDLLGSQLADHADPSVGTHLRRITNAGARMSALIRDLLAYSRISTRQQTFEFVSLPNILTNVLATLHRTIQQTGAQIMVADLPTARGDQSQLSLLFENLLANAIKFVEPGQNPRIQVEYSYWSAKELPPEVRPTADALFYHQISVSDNGIGFENKYLDRIFQVFQRLHSSEVYAGTGVGLSICQRVVENHGGSITANSEPGHGATFCVYLPA